jgi:hypothetical protein
MRPLVPEDVDLNGKARRGRAVASMTRAVLGSALATFEQDRSAVRVVRRQWPQDRQAIAIVSHAASAPAMTTQTGWAAELAQTRIEDLLSIFGPTSCGAALLRHGIVLEWAAAAKISIPGISTVSGAFTSFLAEGAAIPVRQLASSVGISITPHKFATIFTLTREMVESSNAEQLVRLVMTESLNVALDAALLSANAGTAVSPPGLLFGITPITAATGGGITAMVQDLGKLVAAVSPVSGLNVALVTDPGTLTKIALSAISLNSVANQEVAGFNIAMLASNSVTAGTIICVGLNALVSAFEPVPRIDASRDVEISMDTVPTDPSTGTTVVKSMYQVDEIAIRFIADVTWGVRTPSAVAVVNGITW